MKNEKISPSDPIKKWLKETGTEMPGEEFHLSILKKIETLPKTTLVYKPVISPFGWKLILGFILSIIGWGVLSAPVQPESVSVFDKLPQVNLTPLAKYLYDFSLPAPDLSPQFLIGIGAFFILGFIMIIGTMRNKQAGI